MASNFKKGLLTILICFTFFSPVFAPRAQAFWGAYDLNVESVPQLIQYILQKTGQVLAQTMIDRMVQSTIKWAQSGFEGNPAYATNPKQFITSVADEAAGRAIHDSNLSFLCSPFQQNIKLSLAQEYYQPQPFQCSLTQVVGNINNFYHDFSQGGWDAWFSMTQNENNNPYGAYLKARLDFQGQIASAVHLQNQQLDWNQGFASWSKCTAKNPKEFLQQGDPGWDPNYGAEYQPNPYYVSGKAVGDCIEHGPVETPGSTIKAQLDKVLPSGLEKLISAQSLDQLVSAFANGLLNRYVFGSQGLFAGNASHNTNQSNSTGAGNTTKSGDLDVDNDGIPDGRDSDYDGKLESQTDLCYHGGAPSKPADGPGCKLAKDVHSSPYFTPICEAIDRAVITLTEFNRFMDDHADQLNGGSGLLHTIDPGHLGSFLSFGAFGGRSIDDFNNDSDAKIWSNRASEAHTAIDDILSNIQSHHAPAFDNFEIALNRYSDFLDRIVGSLIKDGNLKLARFGNGGGGLENLMTDSANNLIYLKNIKSQIGKCDNPVFLTPNPIPAPPEVPGLNGTSTNPGPGTPGTPGTPGPTTPGGTGVITGTLNPSLTTVVNAPSDVMSWPEETQITSIDFSGPWRFNFGKKDGTGRWPDQFGGPGIASTDPIQYTIWLFLKVNNQWVGSGFIQVWHGCTNCEGGAGPTLFSQLPTNWYYGSQWSPMTGHQLHAGEEIGFMVTSGNSRNGGVPQFKERSNIVLVTLQ